MSDAAITIKALPTPSAPSSLCTTSTSRSTASAPPNTHSSVPMDRSDPISERRAPLVQSMGPALLQEARNALAYGEQMVAEWLARYMLKATPDGAAGVAWYFSDAGTHKSHGRRIAWDEARAQGLEVEDLEESQELQEAVLTAYHLQTIAFAHSAVTKAIASDHGRAWVKNYPRSTPGA